MGTVGTFSFFGNKIITTGEGGMVTLNNPDLANYIWQLRSQGHDPRHRYWHPIVGFNYRMTNLQAALGVAQLERVEEFLLSRSDVAAWYDEELADLADVLDRPRPRPGHVHMYWMYIVVLRHRVRCDRDQLMRRLDADGIDTRPVFVPLHLLPPNAAVGRRLPVAEHIGARGITLPTHSRLTREDVVYIASRLRYHLRA